MSTYLFLPIIFINDVVNNLFIENLTLYNISTLSIYHFTVLKYIGSHSFFFNFAIPSDFAENSTKFRLKKYPVLNNKIEDKFLLTWNSIHNAFRERFANDIATNLITRHFSFFLSHHYLLIGYDAFRSVKISVKTFFYSPKNYRKVQETTPHPTSMVKMFKQKQTTSTTRGSIVDIYFKKPPMYI